MPITPVTLNNTFDEWRTTTNQLITKGDQLELSLSSGYDQANTALSTGQGAFSKANNALANTSGVTFSGDLNITGNLTFIGTDTILDLL